jgi:hypothetical protein
MTAWARLEIAPADMAAVSRLTRLPHCGTWAELTLAPSDDLCVNLGDLQEY